MVAIYTAGAETRVNTFTDGDQSYSSVTYLADGSYIVTWQSFADDDNDDEEIDTYGIYFQRFAANGTAIGVETRANTTVQYHQYQPFVAALSDGGFVITWTADVQDGEEYGVVAQRYDEDGDKVGGEFVVNTDIETGQSVRGITALANGGYVITWEDGFVYNRVYNSAGVAQGDQIYVSSGFEDGASAPCVAALSDGGYVTTWHASVPGEGTFVYFLRSDASGAANGAVTALALGEATEQTYAQVTGLPGGGFVITYVSNIANDSSIVCSRFNSSGTLQGTAVTVSEAWDGAEFAPDIATLSDGGFVIVWTRASTEGSDTSIYSRRFDSDGVATSDEILVNTYTAEDQGYASVAAAANGGYVVTWTSYGQDEGAGSNGIYQKLFSANSAPTFSGEDTLTSVEEGTNATFTLADLLGNANDADEDVLSIVDHAITVKDYDGEVIGTASHSAGVYTIVLTNAVYFTGDVHLTYVISDGSDTVQGSAVYEVTEVNDAPSGTPTGTIDDGTEDTTQFISNMTLIEGLMDYENHGISVESIEADHGELTETEGGWTFTPEANYEGLVTLTYTVTDSYDDTPGLTRTFTLAAVNDAPALTVVPAVLDAGTEDTDYEITLAQLLDGYTDVEDGTVLTVGTITANHGEVSTFGDDVWFITPDEDYNGTVTLSYTVFDSSDPAGATAATRTFTLTAVNDAPELTGSPADLTAGTEDTDYDVTLEQLIDGYYDVEGYTDLTVGTVTADHGQVSNNGDGTWTIRPDADYNGTVTLSYNVLDDSDPAGSTAATRTFSLGAVNDAPTGPPTGTVADGTEDTTQVILESTLLQGFSDVESNTLSVSAISANHGTFEATDGGWTFTPDANYHGSVIVIYTVTDGVNDVTGQTRNFNLTSVNDGPPVLTTAQATLAMGKLNTAYTFTAADLLDGFTDVDNDELSISGAVTATHGTVTDLGDGNYSFAPTTGYIGKVAFTFAVTDGFVTTAGNQKTWILSDTALLATTFNPLTQGAVNNITAGEQNSSSVAHLTGGGYVVTWTGTDLSGS
ncbi:hypothetical protein ABAC460_14730, partial [Asticcacaulis sp. AC460]|uniref:cadherin-like domain-containing protein n=1 Tax=Asticcacaulis sp. AC460 TaxID=1282360 RepID=UPI0003C3ABF3